jgi:hypothetical protein
MLVQSNTAKEAYDNLYDYLNGTTSDFEIPAIAESPILDVFPYHGGDALEEENELRSEEATLEEEETNEVYS